MRKQEIRRKMTTKMKIKVFYEFAFEYKCANRIKKNRIEDENNIELLKTKTIMKVKLKIKTGM